MVYTLMTAHWGLPAPNLVVSVVGGEGRTKVKTWVREVLRQGLVKASQSTGKHTINANGDFTTLNHATKVGSQY